MIEKNRICQLLNIKYPIIQAGMGPNDTSDLAIAVSKAGGLGLISTNFESLDRLRDNIRKVAERSEGSFGVNILVAYHNSRDMVDIVIEEREKEPTVKKNLKAIFTSAGDPNLYTSMIKDVGLVCIHVTSSVYQAEKAEKAGCDAVVAAGYEAGGHLPYDPVNTFILVPMVVDAVKIPVIAAGGIADARGFVAAFIFGAEGIQMGTRFISTREGFPHINYKEAILKAKETDTLVTPGLYGHARTLTNKYSRELQRQLIESMVKKEKLDKPAGPEDLIAYRGKLRKIEMASKEGDVEEGLVTCGMVAGMVKDIPTVKELIERIIKGADDIISGLRIARR